jgi:cation diffusion facilitator CzcD-associated flavoprotein CzcO
MNPQWDVIIIGTGFSGLAMALRLQTQGGYRFVVLEQSSAVGGTWLENRYPGCACDVPSHLYSLSHYPKKDWLSRYAAHDEIWQYLEHVSQPVRPHIRFGSRVVECRYHPSGSCWQVTLESGEELSGRLLVAGLGPLNRPHIPDIPGLPDFSGPCFHSMHWPEGADMTGKRVAVIGTGASAIQIVPALTDQVTQLTVFQRSAPWVVPKNNRRYSKTMLWCLRHLPGFRPLYRALIYANQEWRGLAFLHPGLMRLAQGSALGGMARQVANPRLREQLTPHYAMGCKRIMLSDDYYHALQKPNVRLVTDPIARVTPDGVVTAQGAEIPADILVMATGFRHAETPAVPAIIGASGQSLQSFWQKGRGAYLGMAVAGFPNFFLLAGPNSGLGHNSIVFMIESQVHWIMKALRQMEKRKARVLELTTDAYRRSCDEIERRSRKTVWQTGCRSWYLDADGKNTALWPAPSLTFWLRTRKFHADDFSFG